MARSFEPADHDGLSRAGGGPGWIYGASTVTDVDLIDSEENKEWLEALLRAADDLSVVILGAAHSERFMATYLRAMMPEWREADDPLRVGQIPLSLGVMAKWAFALGFISERVYKVCSVVSDLRNDAAHLKRGANFDLSQQTFDDRISAAFAEIDLAPADNFVNDVTKKGGPLIRAKYLTLVLFITGTVSVQLNER